MSANRILPSSPFEVIECERRMTNAARDAAYQATARGVPSLIIQRNPKSLTFKWDGDVWTGDAWHMGRIDRLDMDKIVLLIERSNPQVALWSNCTGLIRGARGPAANDLLDVLRRAHVHFPD